MRPTAAWPPPRGRPARSFPAGWRRCATHARADPGGAELAAWSLVHGFATLWLNDAVDAAVRAADPMDTVRRIATMLFAG